MPILEKCRPEAIPRNAVTIRVWRSMGRTVADVICPDPGIGGGSNLVAELPRPVPVALKRAAQAAEHIRRNRIAVVIEEDTLWNDDWGALR